MKKSVLNSFLFCVLAPMFLSTQGIEAQKNFKILSYNTLKGFQSDSSVQADFTNWVKKIDPEIVAFQEMNNFTQKKIEEFAANFGHKYAVLSKIEGFSVALTSKYPIVNVQKVVDNMHHAYLVANINHINVIVLHLSPFSYLKRQLEVKEILARADLVPKNEMIIILGDFNSLSEKDSAAYKDLAYSTQRERELKDSNYQNFNNGKFDYSVIGYMENAGYKDVFGLFNKDFQYSFPTTKYAYKDFLKRIDFMFINLIFAGKTTSANFVRDGITDRISDHYPLLVTINLEKK